MTDALLSRRVAAEVNVCGRRLTWQQQPRQRVSFAYILWVALGQEQWELDSRLGHVSR